MIYNDWRQWDIFTKKGYMDKWMRLIKHKTGIWKSVIIIGEYPPNPNVKIVEIVPDEGICTISKQELYPYKSGYTNKSWK